MSSLSHSPYMETLLYWSKKKIPHKFLFLITKFIEMRAFKKNAAPIPDDEEAWQNYTAFNNPIKNNITEKASIAVIVPYSVSTKKSAEHVQCLARNLSFEQTLPADNIIFVDDYSPVKIDFSDFPKIHYYRLEKNSGPATARNTGLAEALKSKYEIIAFTDSDCIPSKTWLKEIKAFFIHNSLCAIVSGKTLSYGHTWFDVYHVINGTLNGRKFIDSKFLLYGPTCNLAITAAVGKSIHFDTSFPYAAGEDIDFCLQANKLGFYIGYNDKMIIEHDFSYTNNVVTNLNQFKKQFMRYSMGEKFLLQKNPAYYIYFDKTEEITSLEDPINVKHE